jgi:hypothetical protein
MKYLGQAKKIALCNFPDKRRASPVNGAGGDAGPWRERASRVARLELGDGPNAWRAAWSSGFGDRGR